jgi:ribokinase
MTAKPITIMGIFVADVAFRTPDLPVWGQTVLGLDFRLGPGGKGSNQSVAAARLGGDVSFISKIGDDAFGGIAKTMYATEKVDTRFLVTSSDHSTGAAAIIIDDASGNNAIVVTPGAANALTTAEIDAAREQIRRSAVFMTQLELPLPTVLHSLQLARDLGVKTILNPAPACNLPDSMLRLCNFLTPNETEAEELTGHRIVSLKDAENAADILLSRGVETVILTLGPRGALVKNRDLLQHIPAVEAGPVVDTTGAGDAFNGGFAVAISELRSIVDAVRFGCTVAGISVTRHGTAPSMPTRAEVDALLSDSQDAVQAAEIPVDR